ncbi:MAG: NAD(P)/FAD-dependent oxidoreductase [Flavisolibacter sp.]
MDLRTYYPYSLLKHGIIQSYPSLSKNIKTDVAIIGAGISGAIVAWQLSKAGIDFVMLDKGHVGQGSTAASTSLIQYELDMPLYKLIKLRGYETAIKSYEWCKKAISDLKKITEEVNDSDNYKEKYSLQFASFKKSVEGLKKEYQIRKQAGFKVDYFDSQETFKQFGIKKPAAIYSYEAAELDAYVLTHKILKSIQAKGHAVYDHTEIKKIVNEKKDITLFTSEGNKIITKKLIITCGYESGKYIPKKLESLRCTYAIISEPLQLKEIWTDNCLIWETSDPYLYLRTTNDNRVIIGGKDTRYFPLKEQLAHLPFKIKSLTKAFSSLFPDIKIKVDFSWAGAFASTRDGLPYIGSVEEIPNTYFALGYGGNGITFSVIAAELITSSILGKKHQSEHMFSFNR